MLGLDALNRKKLLASAVIVALSLPLAQAHGQPVGEARPLPPAPGEVPYRTDVRRYALRGSVTPRFASPRGTDPAQGANLGAMLAPFDPELWSCTRRSGAAIDPSVAAAIPATFRDVCFYEGYETLTILRNDRATGYSRVLGGGYVPTEALRRWRAPSAFHGVMISDGRLPTRVAREGDSVRLGDDAAELEGARPILPPPEAWLATVGDDERWVYVDRDGQVLVAFVGRSPVMITLVSTGRRGFATSLGEYRIIRKDLEGSMRDYDPGRGDRAYFIADVPDIQYFNQGQAFHAAFWHDRFGTAASHGCVNLSVADARWLFEFTDEAPAGPESTNLPEGAVTDPPAPWPQGRRGRGTRVFVYGASR